MESAPPAKVGFFPLDEQLELQPGSLSPHSQEQLVHLAIWMPFRRAVQMLGRLTGVQISEATARRQTYQIGRVVLDVQNAATGVRTSEGKEHNKLIVSPDGAMIPLVGGQWAEVKTVVVGEVQAAGPLQESRSTQLSYFSRLADAPTFTEQASGELLYRGVDQAEQVCAVMDGAEWIDGFVPTGLVGSFTPSSTRDPQRFFASSDDCVTGIPRWKICSKKSPIWKSVRVECSIPSIKLQAGRLARGSSRAATKSSSRLDSRVRGCIGNPLM